MLVNRKIVGTCAPMFGLPTCHADFAWAWSQVVEFNARYLCGPDQEVHYARSAHSVHDIARNQLASAALGEWLYFQDADHVPGPDIVFRLVNAMRRFNADVVSSLYLMRKPPYHPTIWRFNDNGTNDTFADWPKGEILRVDCAGAGSLLVKTAVFRRIWDELGEEPFSRLEFEQGKTIPTGEDFAFFRRLHRLGIRTICPTYIECPHIEERPLRMWHDYDPEKEGRLREVPATFVAKDQEASAA